MKIIAVIPARAGSKRLPGKNVKMLGEHPLIAWTIRAALQSSGVSDVVVTTDDPQAAEIAQRYGATVPGMRPGHLSTDTATSVDVVRYVVDQYEASNAPFRAYCYCSRLRLFARSSRLTRPSSCLPRALYVLLSVSVQPVLIPPGVSRSNLARCSPSWGGSR